MKNALMISALVATLGVSGCATEYIEVKPQCQLPPEPNLPVLDKGELWDYLGDTRYRTVERYIDRLWAYSDEQQAILEAICQ